MSVTHAVATNKVHLKFLDGLRGVCALYVVLHHFLSWSSPGVSSSLQYAIAWTGFGHAAVCVFIVLSGFSLMLQVASSPDRNLRGGIVYYLKRRARRILPPYFAALVLSIVTYRVVFGSSSPDLSAASITSHFLLIHNLFSNWTMSINMAHWTIATEWQIYFLFPLVLLPVWRRCSVLCIPAGIVIGLLPHFLFPAKYNLDWACPWFVALFSMGMVVATYHTNSLPSIKMSRTWLLGMLLFFLGYLGMKVLLRGDAYAWTRDLCAGALVACFIAWCGDSLKGHNRVRVVSWLESRPCVFLGAFSFSLYLTHCAVLHVFNALTNHFHSSPNAALFIRTFLGVPIAIALAYTFYIYFERPFLVNKVAKIQI